MDEIKSAPQINRGQRGASWPGHAPAKRSGSVAKTSDELWPRDDCEAARVLAAAIGDLTLAA
jgi:hypothetical protein